MGEDEINEWDDVQPIAGRIVAALHAKKSLLLSPSVLDLTLERKITAQAIEQAASNHFFDDDSDLFGVTKIEAERFRAYINNRATDGTREYVEKLYQEEFRRFMGGEDPAYLAYINKARIRNGYPPFEGIPTNDS